MPRAYIPKKDRKAVRKRANFCCEYCKALRAFSPTTFHVEHIIPIVSGGDNSLENLAHACGGCNFNKNTKTFARNPETGETVPLFHPRKDKWSDHFKWNDEALKIIGITLTGQLTIRVLDMNREGLVNLRKATKAIGAHPPRA